jgi:hypothetical protein
MGGRSRGRRGIEEEGKGTVVCSLWEGGGEGEAVSRNRDFANFFAEIIKKKNCCQSRRVSYE